MTGAFSEPASATPTISTPVRFNAPIPTRDIRTFDAGRGMMLIASGLLELVKNSRSRNGISADRSISVYVDKPDLFMIFLRKEVAQAEHAGLPPAPICAASGSGRHGHRRPCTSRIQSLPRNTPV